jgi:hypothetical protein
LQGKVAVRVAEVQNMARHVLRIDRTGAVHSHGSQGSLQRGLGSPNFLHFVGLDRGRHPGLPWGVAG